MSESELGRYSDLMSPEFLQLLGRYHPQVTNLLREFHEEQIPRTHLNLFHYTSAEAICSIVQSGELWATHIRHMNDSSELEYGYRVLEKLIKEYPRSSEISEKFLRLVESYTQLTEIGESYVLCFCERGDLLGQWRGYAQSGSGYSLGFGASDLIKSLKSVDGLSLSIPGLLWKVHYNRGWVEDLFRQFLSDMITELTKRIADGLGNRDDEIEEASRVASSFLKLNCLAIKHPAFSDEREYRIVFTFPSKDETPDVRFRIRNNTIVPYINVGFKTEEEMFPLKSLIIGPSVHHHAVERSMRQFLDANRLAGVQIGVSDIPLAS